MRDYIEREKLHERLNQIVDVNNLRTDRAWFTPYGVNALIDEIPAADVRPVKRGKWTLNKDGSGTCSECGFVQNSCWDFDNWDNFCHHCGADMREVLGDE